jgi:hypothetical protein
MEAIDFSKPATQQLHRVILDAYYKEELMVELLESAGFRESDIPFKSTVRGTWQAVLIAADKALKVDAVLSAILADERGAKAHAEIKAFRAGRISLPTPQPAPSDNRPSEASERRSLEKIMGDQPTFLDIAFLQAGLDAARAVARLHMKFSGGWYVGTGFLIAPDLLLTNHHNLFEDSGDRLSELEVWFDYEATLSGAMRESLVARPDLASIVAERDADWGIVRLAEPVPGRMPLRFASAPTKLDAWVAIIQHPKGLPKKIALHHNTVTYADDNVVHYLTDTLGGSSGSPVFDDKWEVVALHHAGGNLLLPGTKTSVYRNEGIPIAKVKARLAARGIRYGHDGATSGAA